MTDEQPLVRHVFRKSTSISSGTKRIEGIRRYCWPIPKTQTGGATFEETESDKAISNNRLFH
jgi:hypothetical protein